MADPHVRIFNGKAFLYSGVDADPNSHSFIMPFWRIYSSDDLVHWELEREIYPNETFMPPSSTSCWATDAAYRNDSYYFFFSNGNQDVGVMSGPTPTGPFVDLGRPLIPTNLTGYHQYDPTVLLDDDGEYYLMFGLHEPAGKSFYFVARLAPDMAGLAEPPRKVAWTGTEQPGDDKSTLHKRGATYYLTSGSWYSTARSVYGPWTFHNATSDLLYGLTGRAHGNFFTWRGQWFHVYCYFSPDPGPAGQPTYRWRLSNMTYSHYTSTGALMDDEGFLQLHGEAGVGVYDAAWERIEAEWFMVAQNASTQEISPCRQPPCRFAVLFEGPGGSLVYPHVNNLPPHGTLTLGVAAARTATTVSVRGSDGSQLASCSVPSSPGPVNVTCSPFVGTQGGTGSLELQDAQGGVLLDAFWLSSA